MATIKIERKKLLWIWILIIIGIVALILLFTELMDGKAEVEKPQIEKNAISEIKPALINIQENNEIVASYINFIEADTLKMSLDHAFTNEALIKLADATNAIATEIGYNVLGNLEKVKEHAKIITKKPFVSSHADSIRKATDILTSVLQNIQSEMYPELNNEANELKNASESINPDVLTLQQKDKVKAFFREAAILLKKMN